VKVAAPLPFTCADLKSQTFLESWEAYKTAWADPRVRDALQDLAQDPAASSRANQWVALDHLKDMPVVV
jgi:hypothetical protein